VVWSLCRFVAASMLTLCGVLLRTTIGTFGGVNDDVIPPLQSSLQRFWSAQLAIRYAFSIY
jgi:hypothetical protein